MGRKNAASASEASAEEFELSAQLSILRRAIAELPVLSDARTARDAARELARFSVLAELVVTSFTQSELGQGEPKLRRAGSAALLTLYQVRQRLEALPARRSSGAAVEAIRRRLYLAIAELSRQVAPLDGVDSITQLSFTELDRALSLRLLLSDFCGAVQSLVRARSPRGWTLVVAEAELGILLERPGFVAGPEATRAVLAELHGRISSFRDEKATVSRAAMIEDVLSTSKLLTTLSRRADVKRHDARGLAGLSVLISSRSIDLATAANAAETLVGLRGMDAELDRLMLDLPFEPKSILVLIGRRVRELRTQALAS